MVFFFKQKTAYEMRISDWSSDVCSSDLSGDPDLHQWFTPFWAAEMFANDVLDGLGHVGVIEPSCGTGSFLSAIPQHLPAYGVDIDPDIAAEIGRAHV